MQIDISPDLHAKLQQQVDAGRFPDVDAALRTAVDRLSGDAPEEESDAIDTLLLQAIAQSRSGSLFDGQPVSLAPPKDEAPGGASEKDGEQWN